MPKPEVIQLPNGDWAVVNSTHSTKGAADKAANEMLKTQRRFKLSLTEDQIQKVFDALTFEDSNG